VYRTDFGTRGQINVVSVGIVTHPHPLSTRVIGFKPITGVKRGWGGVILVALMIKTDQFKIEITVTNSDQSKTVTKLGLNPKLTEANITRISSIIISIFNLLPVSDFP